MANSGLFVGKFAGVSAGISNLTYVYHSEKRLAQRFSRKLNTAVCDTALASQRTVPPLICYASRRSLTPWPYVLSLADPLPALIFKFEVLSV